jgi:hypothetical protein
MSRLTWAAAWGPGVRQSLTAGGRVLVGREVMLTYTHRTVIGALREARVTALS